MELKGWVRTSLIEYPDHIATVLFTGGCNFRCPPCHNADLVLSPGELPDLHHQDVWDHLSRRTGQVDGLVITGGEPTSQADLVAFLRRIQEFGLDVKLDTNGYRPDVLSQVLAEGLVDYVAMDVKAPPDKLSRLTGRPDLDVNLLDQSITLLRDSHRSYEFRTTVVPGLLDEGDVAEIARWVAGAERYVLQQFRPLRTLDPALEKVSPYPPERLEAMAVLAGRWVARATVRGSWTRAAT